MCFGPGLLLVFFAASTGEIERLADILNEYGTAYQLGLAQSGETPEYLAERAYFAGSVASTFLVKGAVPRGVFLASLCGVELRTPIDVLAVRGAGPLIEALDAIATGAYA